MEQFAPRKTILVSKPNISYPACWFHIPDENEAVEASNIPAYDLEQSKNGMERTFQLTNVLKNSNPEDDDWESKILKYGWTTKQTKLFNKVVQILDFDHLARLANVDGKRHEVVQVRTTIDKSADRMRHALAEVSWDTVIIQWIHAILMEYLPPSYLASYLDIMQTLKHKVPSLVDRMIFWKPGNVSQDLLGLILKRPWQPVLSNKYRKIPGSAILVVIPPLPRISSQPARVQRLYTLFTTMAPILPVQLQINHLMAQKQSLQSIAEQLVSLTRTKIQELKAENQDRRIILVGMHASSALALQVSLVEQVSGIVCFGFSCNTVHGPRGHPDDHILNLTTPIMFMIGQNAARTSEEEIEQFREKMTAPSTLLTVGSADDYLRVSKKKRKLEGVTQEMVDNMIVDEIAEFATKCIQRPLPQKPKSIATFGNVTIHRQIDSSTGQMRKRKSSQIVDADGTIKLAKMKPVKMMKPSSTTNFNNSDAVEMAVQSILPDSDGRPVAKPAIQRASIGTGVAQRLKIVPQNQFTTLKPQSTTTQKYYTIESKSTGQKNYIAVAQRAPNRSQPSTPGNSRPATPQTQYVTNARISSVGKLPIMHNQTSFSPPKFTIVRQGSSAPNTSFTADTELSGTNIFDMPVVFADSEGNIDEDSSNISDNSVIEIPSDHSTGTTTKKVILKASNIGTYVNAAPTQTVTITKNKNILIQKPSVPSKMLVLNGNVIGRSIPASNIVLPKSSIQPQPIKIQKIVTTGSSVIPTTSIDMKNRQQISSNKKIEILNNQIIKPAMTVTTASTVPKSVGFVNLADAKPISANRLSIPFSTVKGSQGQQIVIKTANLKQFTLSGHKQLGNLTVKKVNVVPSTATTIASSDQPQQPKIIFKNA
ncbi:hypothetical protein ACKWTF_009474 [Chironomus riparius]